MKTTLKIKLGGNTDFRKLYLQVMAREIKTELDRLTVEGDPTTIADQKLLVKLQYWMVNDGFQDRTNPQMAAQMYVTSLLAMFGSEEVDDLNFLGNGDKEAINLDLDESETILLAKIKGSAWLYGLAGVTDKADFMTNIDGTPIEVAE